MSPVVTGEDFAILTDEPFWEEVKKDVLRRLLPSFQKLLLAGVDFAEAARITYKALDEVLTGDKQLPVPVDYDRLTTELFTFLPTYTDEWWNKLDVVTRDQLRASMTVSVAAGESTEKLVKRLDPTFGAARAERIATTETTRLFNEGSKRTYAAAGVEWVVWRSVHDNAVCPECEALDGEEWPLDAVPTDPPLHVLCRCYLSPVVSKDAKPEVAEVPPQPAPAYLGDITRLTPRTQPATYYDDIDAARRVLKRKWGDDAGFKALEDAAHTWGGSATDIREVARKWAETGKFEAGSEVATRARALSNAVSQSQPIEGSIWRGMSWTKNPIDRIAPEWVKGTVIDVELSSATFNSTLAKNYAGILSERTGVLLEFKNAQGLPVSALSGWPAELEVIVGGEFRVVSTELLSGTDNVLHVVLEQVGKLPNWP